MGCCESSNRRKIDEALNPIMGTAGQDQLVPLMSEAAFKGDISTMERLVAKGALYDRTPLHFAAFNGHVDAVKWLINKVAGMVNGFTPLFAACENNDLDVAKVLVEAGADTNAKSRDGRTPIQHALHHNRTYVADYLYQVQQSRSPSKSSGGYSNGNAYPQQIV
ncbi:hypothetical protein GUITHDRAFT_163913 [Guillardia theta CCMP2712]|uniref:Uncharacterized protein n=1 Tax=Guillardia theta (strain CCMP2712) TaxID=905079 RepID=L1J5J6_GUITC|nr:hypothetical protein GUITHDRAFT_163913 [Guillardia theta CCMP2712]EKX43350.1 hypothetical protein GUITHDRAFT_163913 [Guillardia theta CCMP2712]|eukprot:XP_005830330.1 hypothetical protein GUITHDRAFT_163913 [Guillardia theta CCMP2712]